MSEIMQRNRPCLGVPGTPPIVNSLSFGEIYAVTTNSVPIRTSAIAQALQANLRNGLNCALVTAQQPGALMNRASASGVDFSPAVNSGQLAILAMRGDYTKNIFRFGADRFLAEFDHFQIPPGSLIIIEHASELFTSSDGSLAFSQAQQYREWFRQKGHVGIFYFNGAAQESLLDHFSGSLRLMMTERGVDSRVDFWYSADGAVAAQGLGVNFDERGQMQFGPETNVGGVAAAAAGGAALAGAGVAAAVAEPVANDTNEVYYVGSGMSDWQGVLAGDWTEVSSLDALVDATANAIGATAVIAVDARTNLRDVDKTIYRLRQSRGSQLRIVIREISFALRYSNKLVFFRLGANMVVNHDTTSLRLKLVWESLDGMSYKRELPANPDQLAGAASASNMRGYQPLAGFCREVLRVLDASEQLELPNILLEADIQDGDVPRLVKAAGLLDGQMRTGDLVSSDGKRAYVFLHACSEGDAMTTLSRLLQQDPRDVFSSIGYWDDGTQIRSHLNGLLESGANGAPDFSAELRGLKSGVASALEKRS